MNGKDLIAVLEYAKAFNAPKKSKMKRKNKEFDLVERLRQMKEEAELLEKFLEDQKKLAKKDDKDKPKPHSFTFAEGMILAYAAQFVLGPLYKIALIRLGVPG